jgi:hypothetical protein
MRPVPIKSTPGEGFLLARYRAELVVLTKLAPLPDRDVEACAAAGHGICT